MYLTELTFFGGLLLGLASTLHCSAMCGGISCSALLSLGGTTTSERFRHALLLQLGRILAYCLLGGVGAAFGSAFMSSQKTMTFQSMQWIAAVVLMWSGLAMAGMMPRFVFLDAVFIRMSSFLERLTSPMRGTRAAPMFLGLLWGLNPCPMVYAALFTATLTASVLTGVFVMAGFGVGTMPGVLLAGLGLTSFKNFSFSRNMQTLAGILLAVFGFASLYIPATKMLSFCVSP